MYRIGTVICNVCWLLSMLPGWLCFQLALWFPDRSQRKVLRRILRDNGGTQALRHTQFDQLPTRDYEELWPDIQRMMKGGKNILTEETPLLLEPTGGSSTGTKLIPYTRSLKKEFQHAIDPWIAGLFIKWPSLLTGRHYWCITPSTSDPRDSVIPIGFDTDASYLGRIQQSMLRRILAVPEEVSRCVDHSEATFQTLVHLLNTPDLRLISVWHPSLLTLMLQTLEERFDELLEAVPKRRASELRRMGCVPSLIWKKLKIISCWSGDTCKPWIDQLATTFPHTIIQPKGLVATEGITSIPLGSTQDVAAVRSHYYEFECEDSGTLVPLTKVQPGKTYHLILTTGGGLYRYRTNDRVKITGCHHRTPCIRFLTRTNMTSDLFGEKISLAQAERICSSLPCPHTFAMLAPEQSGNAYRYALYIETGTLPHTLSNHLENGLLENYHYRHARNLGQLAPSVVHGVENATKKVARKLGLSARQAGSIKIMALRRETGWNEILLSNTEEVK